MIKSTAWVHDNRAGTAELVAREMHISQAHAERGWDYYTSRGVLSRDLSPNLHGLENVIKMQIAARLLPQDTVIDTAPYIEPGYLAQARAGAI